MVGQPGPSGFLALASQLPGTARSSPRPRGLGRSTRSDGDVTNSPTVQAEDLHVLVRALAAGPVEIFASSGGAVSALALVTAYPEDVATLVAHEPPLIRTLPDAETARRASAAVQEVYRRRFGRRRPPSSGDMLEGRFTDDYSPGRRPTRPSHSHRVRRLARRRARRPVVGVTDYRRTSRAAGGGDPYRPRCRRGARDTFTGRRQGHRAPARPGRWWYPIHPVLLGETAVPSKAGSSGLGGGGGVLLAAALTR